MKKFNRYFILFAVSTGLFIQTGCFGSFKLIEKVYEWNGSIEDKFVRSIVFWALCIIPVYAIAGFVDIVILNVIEFWSGSNPVSMRDGEHEEQVVAYKGRSFLLEASKNRFSITEINGKKANKPVKLLFTPENLTWNLEQDQRLIALSRLEQDDKGRVCLRLFTKNAKSRVIPYYENADWTAFRHAILNEADLTATR